MQEDAGLEALHLFPQVRERLEGRLDSARVEELELKFFAATAAAGSYEDGRAGLLTHAWQRADRAPSEPDQDHQSWSLYASSGNDYRRSVARRG